MDIEEIGINAGNWVDSAQVMGLRVPQNILLDFSIFCYIHLVYDLTNSNILQDIILPTNLQSSKCPCL